MTADMAQAHRTDEKSIDISSTGDVTWLVSLELV